MPSVLEVLMKRLVKTSKVPAPDVEPEEIASERRLVDSFFQSTTLHGLLQVWSAETKCLKFIFLLSFLICNCAAFYYCYKHIHEYLTDPARASYLIEEAEKLDLPDLTICGFNRFSKERLNAYSISTGLAEYMQWAFIVSAPDYDFINITNQNRKQRRRSHRYEELLNRTLTDHQLTFEQLLRNVSIQCEDLISSCVTNSPRRRYNCCKNATTIMTDSGQCFRIPGITQLGSGYGMGITVLVKIPVHLHTHNNNMANNEGILVKLTEQGKGYDFDAIFVPTGVHALLSLRAVRSVSLSSSLKKKKKNTLMTLFLSDFDAVNRRP